MCLDFKYSEEYTKKVLKKLPEEISVYKVVIWHKGDANYFNYISPIYMYHYIEGENKTVIDIGNIGKNRNLFIPVENIGFYSFKTKMGAWWYKTNLPEFTNRLKIIKCKIYKKDINYVGEKYGCFAFISSKITIPKYKRD